VRGYTSFTQTFGDEAAPRLAASFAKIAREGVEAHGGRRGAREQGVLHLARAVEGIAFHDHGEFAMKGLDAPVRVSRVSPNDLDPDARTRRSPVHAPPRDDGAGAPPADRTAPGGRRGTRGEHRGTLDVKHAGITPITNLARFCAIDAGLTENRTVDRLRGAASAGRISDRLREDLEEGFRLLWRIRLEHHVMRVESGAPPDDFVDPETLRPIPRSSLGSALRLVAEAQAELARRYGLR